MLKINSKTIVYVVCPAFNKTGGTELEHQLVFELNKIGVKAFITYYDDNSPKINPAFEKYVSSYKEISDIDDNENNILILPEIRVELLKKYKNIQKCVWWMSVDNYLKRNGFRNVVNNFGILKAMKYIFFTSNARFFEPQVGEDVLNLYQSEYAHQFLLNKGFNNVARLSDYVNQDYIQKTNYIGSNRKNEVLYNPKKGIEYTKKLMLAAPELTWRPIQGMTNSEVKTLLRSSKLYIDFGNHPGKDRFPREAAISGCCVITDKRGSAKYYKDIPIPEKYKIEDKDSNIQKIISRIKDCLSNYEVCINDFESYRKYIANESELFSEDVKKIFS